MRPPFLFEQFRFGELYIRVRYHDVGLDEFFALQLNAFCNAVLDHDLRHRVSEPLAYVFQPLDSAVMMIPGLAVTVALGLGAVPLARRFGAIAVMVLGVIINGVGYLAVSALGHTGSGAVLLVGFVLVCAGVGISETVSNDLALGAVPASKAGAASAVSETAYEIGAVLGTAVLGSLLNLAYRQGVQVPATLDPDATAQARSTLGGAVDVAGDLPATSAGDLLRSAAHAFDSGVTLTAAIAAVLSFAVALTAHRVLRPRGVTVPD